VRVSEFPSESLSCAQIRVRLSVMCQYCCMILTKTGMCRQSLVKLSNVKFQENTSGVVEFLWTDGQADMAKTIDTLSQLVSYECA
jgi:hypothetical protein